jgi:outer membrane protein assembly factor BamB/PKD repeat protein
MRALPGVAIAAVVVVLVLLLPPRALPTSTPPETSEIHLSDGATPPPSPPAPLPPVPPSTAYAGASGGSWPEYLGSPERTGANFQERTLAPSNISQLELQWKLPSKNGSIYSSPVVINGTVFVGDGAGYEFALRASDGRVLWETDLGQQPGCDEYYGIPYGTISAPQLWNGTLYLGGGDGDWYALNASTGAVEWRVNLASELAFEDNCDYASALLYRGAEYIALSTNPAYSTSSGELLQVSLTGNHSIENVFHVEPTGGMGGPILGTPALDPAANTIWFTTGWGYDLPNYNASPYSSSIIALNASTLHLEGSWQDPESYGDLSPPILLTDATGRLLVVVTDGAGRTFALNRSNVSSSGTWGPVWKELTGYSYYSELTGPTASFDGRTLFVVGGDTYSSNFTWIPYEVLAIDPVSGARLWTHTTTEPVVGGLAYANGLVMDATETGLEVLSAANGTRLATYDVPQSEEIQDAPAVADGRIYFGTVASGYGLNSGTIYSLGLALSSAYGTADRANGTAPLPVQFHAVVAGGEPPYSFNWQFSDGTNSTSPSPDHVFEYPALFTVELTVQDAAGNVRYWNSSVAVTPAPPKAPTFTVYVGASPPIGAAPLHVRFTATEEDGTVPPYTFGWSFSDGTPPALGSSLEHTFATPGSYAVYVTATEANGTVATALQQIHVVAPLSASSSVTPVQGTAPVELAFAASAQGGLGPYAYAWNFGDDSPLAEVANTTHTYPNGGTYTALLTITDSLGEVWTHGTELDFNAPSIPLWLNVSKISQSYNCTSGQGLVALTAVATGGVAPVTFSWQFFDGTSSVTGSNVLRTYSSFAPIGVTVIATDAAGVRASLPVVVPLASTACPHPYSGVDTPISLLTGLAPWASPSMVGAAIAILLADMFRRQRGGTRSPAR